jgi:hypothetical protein
MRTLKIEKKKKSENFTNNNNKCFHNQIWIIPQKIYFNYQVMNKFTIINIMQLFQNNRTLTTIIINNKNNN